MKDADLTLEMRDDDSHGPDPRSPRPHVATASFRDTDAVQLALEELIRMGVPRDLIDIVVSPEAAEEYYPKIARDPGSDALRFAGGGGLIGLIVGSIISLVLIMLPGFFDDGIIPYVQLIGPNFVTVLGAMVGALIGLLRHHRPDPRFERAAREPDSIIVVVTLRSEGEAERVTRILGEVGGNEPVVET